MKRFRYRAAPVLAITGVSLLLAFSGCSKKEAAWVSLNNKLIKDNNIQVRKRSDLVETGITPSLEPGKVVPSDSLKFIEIAPGVKGKLYWGKAVLVNWVTMEPNAEIPRETLPAPRMMLVVKGSVEQLVNGYGKNGVHRCKTGLFFLDRESRFHARAHS